MYGRAKVSAWPFKYLRRASVPGAHAYLRWSAGGENRGIERRRREEASGKNGKKKKVRWKRMYVGHVAAGIASMCHRGNHAGNAEAHLTTLPPCIYLPPAIPYIFTVSVLPQTVLPPFLLSFSFPPFLLLAISLSVSPVFRLRPPPCHLSSLRRSSARTSKKFARRGNPNAKIRKTRAVLAF